MFSVSSLFSLLVMIQNLSWSAAETRQLVLKVGEKTTFTSSQDLALPQNKILHVRDLGQAFQLTALKPGYLQMRLGETSYQVSVIQQKQFETFDLLKNETKKTIGLRVKIESGLIILDGKLSSGRDWFALARACVVKNCDYSAQFSTHPDMRPSLQTELSKYFESLGFNSFRIRWAPELQIMVPSQMTGLAEFEKTAAAFGLKVTKEAGALELAPSIRAQIMILEVRKQETLKYGIKWAAGYSAQLLPKVEGIDALMVTAQFLENSGIGRVLASPSLLCRSGRESEFLAGGEIPIKVMSEYSGNVIWKKYGIVLRLKPQADFSGRMSLAIETEISKIDPAHVVDGIPGFETNRVQSHFDLNEPRTIALSGLIRMEDGKNMEGGLPWLSKIPILGPLFSSREFQKSQTELVILVRPELVTVSDGSR